MSVSTSIIIVNYNTRTLAMECITSIYKETSKTRFEIILVDNASSDGSADAIAASFPAVRIIRNEENLGFPRATNAALEEAVGRYILLLNPDTRLLDGCLDRLVEFMDSKDSNASIGIVGPKMFDQNMIPWSNEDWRITPLRYLFRGFLTRRAGNGDHDVEWVCGACLMIRSEVIDQIGYLDTYMFGEDMDWCVRAKRSGWRVRHLARARIIHHFGSAAGVPELAAGRVFVTRQSKLYYSAKLGGRREAAFFSAVLALEALIAIPFFFLKSFTDPDRAQMAKAKITGFSRVLRSVTTGEIVSADQKWWKHPNS